MNTSSVIRGTLPFRRRGRTQEHDLRNLQSDTQMRNAIAGTGSGSEDRGTRLP